MKETAVETYPKLFFVTHPRSGLNYFAEYFLQVTGYNLARSHSIDDYKLGTLVTIVRNPVDTLASHVSMMCATSNFKNLSNIAELANASSDNYEDFYKDVVPKADIVISYDRFIKSPEDTLSVFLDRLNIPYTMKQYEQTLSDRAGEYMVSSSKDPLYEIIKLHYSQYNLRNHFDLYTQALDRCQ